MICSPDGAKRNPGFDWTRGERSERRVGKAKRAHHRRISDRVVMGTARWRAFAPPALPINIRFVCRAASTKMADYAALMGYKLLF